MGGLCSLFVYKCSVFEEFHTLVSYLVDSEKPHKYFSLVPKRPRIIKVLFNSTISRVSVRTEMEIKNIFCCKNLNLQHINISFKAANILLYFYEDKSLC